jgi:hypothetical protein
MRLPMHSHRELSILTFLHPSLKKSDKNVDIEVKRSICDVRSSSMEDKIIIM